MCAEISLTYDLGREIRIGLVSDISDAVCRALKVDAHKLVDVFAALESEMLKSLKPGSFGKDRDVELAGLLDHVVREVKLVDCYADPVRFCSDLHHGVNDAAVIFGAVLCRQDKESVSQVVHGFTVHAVPLSSGVAPFA